MDKYTQTYLNIINEDTAKIQQVKNDQNSYKTDYQSPQVAKLNFSGFIFGEEFKESMRKWIYDFLEKGQYFADNTIYLTQDLFFVINTQYGLRDKENDFEIHLCTQKYLYGKQEWVILKQFEEFNKNEVPQAVDTICAWLDSKKQN